VTLPDTTSSGLRTHLIDASVDRPGDDPIFALNAEAKQRAAAGEDVLNATIGALMGDDGRLAVMPSVFEAFGKVSAERAAAYAPIAGEPRFLAAVKRDLFGESALVEQAVAVATPGGTGAVHHGIVNVLEPGQKLLTTSYYWGPYQILAEHTRRGVETFRMFNEHGRLDMSSLERELARQVSEQGRVLLVLNTPCHNPTGYSLDEREWSALVSILMAHASEAPITLLLDLAYARFGASGSVSWVPFVEELAGEVLVMAAWTVSKSFAQYGARVGALVAVDPDPAERHRLQNALSYSCRGTWSNCNHLGMLAITELLADPVLRAKSDVERDELRKLLGQRVAEFNAEARKVGLPHPRYEGGFFVTVFTPDAELTARTMRASGVFVVPLQGGVRVALCSTPTRDIPRLVEALDRGVRAARG